MSPIYLPLVLALATPLPAESHPTAWPTPSPTATVDLPSATPTSPPTEPSSPEPSATTAPSATSAPIEPTTEPKVTPGSGVVEIVPISTRIAKRAEGDGIRWSLWAEFINPTDQEVASVGVTARLLDKDGAEVGDRFTLTDPRMLPSARAPGCIQVSWVAPDDVTRVTLAFSATFAAQPLFRPIPSTIHKVTQNRTTHVVEVEASVDVTRSALTQMTGILRDEDGSVLACSYRDFVDVDPGRRTTYELPAAEGVLAKAPDRTFSVREILPSGPLGQTPFELPVDLLKLAPQLRDPAR